MNTESAVSMIERLVGFDTTSAKSNLPLIEDVADCLDGHGVSVRLTGEDTSVKANLFASIGPEKTGGLVLSGHTDVVPVDGQPWDTDPFRLIESDGRLFGRGTTDMKSFIACALALVPEMRSRNLSIPIHFALSYDEEVGCLGVRSMIDMIRDAIPTPRLAIVGEPTEMRVVNSHKGINVQTTVVSGRDAHSSQPQVGVNAVSYAAEIIAFLGRLADEYRQRADKDGRFTPPGTTFNMGLIEGGTAVNIIARECRFRWEFRPAPGTDPREILERLEQFVTSEILPRMHATDPAASVVTTVDVTAPMLEPVKDSPAEQLALHLTGANASTAAAYVCEAGLFAGAGIPAVVCGPGSIAQAHQPNEFIELSQVEACLEFLQRLIDYAATA